MLIGVISDTHNQYDRTARAIELMVKKKVEAIFHCGDLTRPKMVSTITASGVPCYFVYGNNDDPGSLSLEINVLQAFDLKYSGIITLGDRKIGMAHGDRPALMQKLAAQEPDYIFFGHSHLATDFQQGPIRFVNPGAMTRAPRWSFTTIDLTTGELFWHTLED
ncbi:MAG: metallophosphoesterase family protein [bacterium]